MNIRTWLSLSLAALPGLALPGLALAGVDTNLPPVMPVVHQGGKPVPAGAKTPAQSSSAATRTLGAALSNQPASKVPAISPVMAEKMAATHVWQQSIATPPEGPETPETARLAQQSLAASHATDNTPPVIRGENGAILSLSGRPVLVCSPLHTCIIELPDGVKPVTTVGVSTSEWTVQQALVGKQPEIFLSPKFKGLHQNIVVAATDRGRAVNYEIRLISDAVHYIPALKIEDSGGEVRTWKTALQTTASITQNKAATDQAVADHKGKTSRVLSLPNIRPDHINLRWSIHCGGGGWFSSSDCTPIRPLWVYDDGTHTFINMPQGLANHGGFPILQARNASGHLIGVNTQIRGNTYVVDSVPAEILLRLGSEVVTIQHEEK